MKASPLISHRRAILRCGIPATHKLGLEGLQGPTCNSSEIMGESPSLGSGKRRVGIFLGYWVQARFGPVVSYKVGLANTRKKDKTHWEQKTWALRGGLQAFLRQELVLCCPALPPTLPGCNGRALPGSSSTLGTG